MGTIRKRFSFGMTDEELICLFPYGKVRMGSNILIYGAGRAGQYFLQQIKATGYCNVLALVDCDWDKYDSNELNTIIIPPDKIHEYIFDNIVIAISSDSSRKSIFDFLTNEIGIDAQKIVSEPCLVEMNYLSKNNLNDKMDKNGFAYNKVGGNFTIAFYAKGGDGRYNHREKDYKLHSRFS